MTVSELINKLLELNVKPDTEVLIRREDKPLSVIEDVNLMTPYSKDEPALIIEPKLK